LFEVPIKSQQIKQALWLTYSAVVKIQRCPPISKADGYERFMFYPVSKAIWVVVAPTNVLILITAAATLWAVLRVSKWAAWLAVTGACALVIGGFTPEVTG
jgi:hypothetical protein